MLKTIPDILREWFYRLPYGYAIQPYNDAELQVLSKILTENNIDPNPIIRSLAELDDSVPSTSTPPKSQDTNYKEGMVVYFLALTDNNFTSYFNYLKKPSADLIIPDFIKPNAEHYGSNDLELIENAIKYLIENKDNPKLDLNPYIQPFSTAMAIRNKFGQQQADRGARLVKVKEEGAKAAAKMIGKPVTVDKWCPADIFLFGNSKLQADSLSDKLLTVGEDSVNGQFAINLKEFKAGKVVGISLKESNARAGKAKSFEAVLTRKDAYPEAPNLDKNLKAHISILYYTEGFLSQPTPDKLYYLSEVARRLTTIPKEMQTNQSGNLLNVLQPILLSAFGDNKILGKSAAKKIPVDTPITPNQLADLQNAVAAYNESIKDQAKDVYDKYQELFFKSLTNEKISFKINTAGSQPEDPHTLLKKAGCYQIAEWFITGLGEGKGLEIPEQFKSLSRERGAFVALTAFAVGMAGISPNFIKAKAGKTVDSGHLEGFYGTGYLNMTEGTDAIIRDSAKYKGFQVVVTTSAYESDTKGAKAKNKYETKLDFRYSGDALFIEVGALNAI